MGRIGSGKSTFAKFLVKLHIADKGKILCEPSAKVGSHMLTSALGANCILGANPGAEDLIEGDAIQVNLLPWADLK